MIIAVVIVILFIIIFFKDSKISEYFTMTRIRSLIDSNEYLVVNSYKDKEKAADLIANINIFTLKFIQALKDKYISEYTLDTNMTPREYIKGHEIALILLNRFKTESLRENEPDSVDKTSYTTNKGEVISLCLREKISGENKFHDLSVLKFVLMHELGHIITPEINHSALFWTNFRFLLDFCNKYDLYTAPDYDTQNVNYCGLNVSYNPVTDTTLSSYFTN